MSPEWTDLRPEPPRLSPRHVVVTGAGGLIGRSVVRQLIQRGDRVTAILRSGSASTTADIRGSLRIDLTTDPRTVVAGIGPFDAVIHLAQAPGWHHFPDQAGAISAVTVTAPAYLAEAAIRCGARCFVLASSGGIYGPSPEPVQESASFKPPAELGFYLTAKIASEKMMRSFMPHLAVHILRPFFVYGPGQKPPFLVPRLLQAVLSGSPIRVDQGRGSRLNPVYVEDAAAAFVAALDFPDPVTINVAGTEVVTVKGIAETLGRLVGREPILEDTGTTPNDYIADITTMTALVQRRQRTMAAGLASLVETLHEIDR